MNAPKKSLSERISQVEFIPTVPAGVLAIVADRSGSMSQPTAPGNTEPKIAGLIRGIEAAIEVLRDPPGGVRPMVGFVTFGGDIHKVAPAPASSAAVPPLKAANNTPLGSAIETGLEMIESTLGELNRLHVPFKSP